MASATLSSSVPQAAQRVVAAAAKRTRKTGRTATGIVVSAGLTQQTVKVRLGGEIWNKQVKKSFRKPVDHLVHDPNNSLHIGDAVEISSGWRTSKAKRWVVNRIIAPSGTPIEERPPIPTREEREAERALKRKMKTERKYLRKQTEKLQQRIEHAEKVTGEITRMVQNMKLVRDVKWTATPS